MNFSLNDEQKQLQGMVSDFCREEVAPGAEARDQKAEFPTQLFLKLASLGIPAIPHSTEYGGLGLGTFEM
ncbi:MAG: acyl-CoA dehydrogenase family protein, partial [Nitrospirota bacterium]